MDVQARLVRVEHDGLSEMVTVYSGMAARELRRLLRAVFADVLRADTPVGLIGADGAALPLSTACAHPDSLTAAPYTLLLKRKDAGGAARAGTAAAAMPPAAGVPLVRASSQMSDEDMASIWADVFNDLLEAGVVSRGDVSLLSRVAGEGALDAALDAWADSGDTKQFHQDIVAALRDAHEVAEELAAAEQAEAEQQSAGGGSQLLRFVRDLEAAELLTPREARRVERLVRAGDARLQAAYSVAAWGGDLPYLRDSLVSLARSSTDPDKPARGVRTSRDLRWALSARAAARPRARLALLYLDILMRRGYRADARELVADGAIDASEARALQRAILSGSVAALAALRSLAETDGIASTSINDLLVRLARRLRASSDSHDGSSTGSDGSSDSDAARRAARGRPAAPTPAHSVLVRVVDSMAASREISKADAAALRQLVSEEDEYVMAALEVYETAVAEAGADADDEEAELRDTLARIARERGPGALSRSASASPEPSEEGGEAGAYPKSQLLEFVAVMESGAAISAREAAVLRGSVSLRDPQMANAYKKFTEDRDFAALARAVVARVRPAAGGDGDEWTDDLRARHAYLVDEMVRAGLLTGAEGKRLTAPVPDVVVRAAWSLFDDDLDQNELVDTLTRVARTGDGAAEHDAPASHPDEQATNGGVRASSQRRFDVGGDVTVSAAQLAAIVEDLCASHLPHRQLDPLVAMLARGEPICDAVAAAVEVYRADGEVDELVDTVRLTWRLLQGKDAAAAGDAAEATDARARSGSGDSGDANDEDADDGEHVASAMRVVRKVSEMQRAKRLTADEGSRLRSLAATRSSDNSALQSMLLAAHDVWTETRDDDDLVDTLKRIAARAPVAPPTPSPHPRGAPWASQSAASGGDGGSGSADDGSAGGERAAASDAPDEAADSYTQSLGREAEAAAELVRGVMSGGDIAQALDDNRAAGDVDVAEIAEALARGGHPAVLAACDVYAAYADEDDLRDTLVRVVRRHVSGADASARARADAAAASEPRADGEEHDDDDDSDYVPSEQPSTDDDAQSDSDDSSSEGDAAADEAGCSDHELIAGKDRELVLRLIDEGHLELSADGEAALRECVERGDVVVHAALESFVLDGDAEDLVDTLVRVAQRAVSVGPLLQTKKALASRRAADAAPLTEGLLLEAGDGPSDADADALRMSPEQVRGALDELVGKGLISDDDRDALLRSGRDTYLAAALRVFALDGNQHELLDTFKLIREMAAP